MASSDPSDSSSLDLNSLDLNSLDLSSLDPNSLDLSQLEADFTATVRAAIVDPEDANLLKFWQEIEPVLRQLPNAAQLQFAGTVIVELAELYAAKADRFLADWQERHNDEGPVLDEDLLAGLVQRTMYLALEDLIRPKEKPPRRRKPTHSETDSVAGAVDKQKLLIVLEQIEDQETVKQQALNVAHDEDVSAWIRSIDRWLESLSQAMSISEVPFGQLCSELQAKNAKMTLIKIWLALLLGGYELEQRGDFYDRQSIWIKVASGEGVGEL